MTRAWSSPVPYNLERTLRRASVPRRIAKSVPETPGTYVIYCFGRPNTCDAVLDIGETGPRPTSTPHGLRGRLATTVAHSASAKIAAEINDGKLPNELFVVWLETESKEDAKELQDSLITLFRQECGRQPLYNTMPEQHPKAEAFESIYAALKTLIGCV